MKHREIHISNVIFLFVFISYNKTLLLIVKVNQNYQDYLDIAKRKLCRRMFRYLTFRISYVTAVTRNRSRRPKVLPTDCSITPIGRRARNSRSTPSVTCSSANENKYSDVIFSNCNYFLCNLIFLL